MRARINRIVHHTPTVQIEMDLREAYALGVVLSAVEGETQRDKRLRQAGRDLLLAGMSPSVPAAEEIAAAAEIGADPKTASGRLALGVATTIRTAVERSRLAAGESALGPWVSTEGTERDGKESAQ